MYSALRMVMLGLGCMIVIVSFTAHPSSDITFKITEETPLWDVMTQLGKINPNSVHKKGRGNVTKGKELVMTGVTRDLKGKKIAPIAGKMACVSCHNLEPEHPSLSVIAPQQRLEHADSMGIAFVPGSPFFGMVNRIMFFTDDFISKYNPPKAIYRQYIMDGHRDIRLAINACNMVNANGRRLEMWEVESILAFMWTMELKIGDLAMKEEDLRKVEGAIVSNRDNARAVNLLRRYYPEVYPAAFPPIMEVAQRKRISPVINSFSNGKRLYKKSCLHCHLNKRYSNFKLDSKQKTFKMLKKHFDDDSRYSIYLAHRYNPDPKAFKTTAPLFTEQRMSDKQLQDLRFFIKQMARLGDEAYDYFKNF
ncbi:MAG: hypothetical protein GY810_24135 [Aureispira sp.]|nr:hypothetical protein [Aureispira sp.]